MPEKIVKKANEQRNAPLPGSGEEYNANHLSASAGHPLHLPDGLRARLEARTGVDLGNIQMRESDQPESIGARAFARGNVIDFAPGEFRPGTAEGEAVIGHEVSHVIQQARGEVRPDSGASPVNSDPALEHAADRGESASGMESVPTMSYSSSPVQGIFGYNHYQRWKTKKRTEELAKIFSKNHTLEAGDYWSKNTEVLAPAGEMSGAEPYETQFDSMGENGEINPSGRLRPPPGRAPAAPDGALNSAEMVQNEAADDALNSAGTEFGSLGSLGTQFDSLGSLDTQFGSMGSLGTQFGSMGSLGTQFGSMGSLGTQFGSLGSFGTQFGSLGMSEEDIALNTPLTPPNFPAPKAPAPLDLNIPLTPPSFPAPKAPGAQAPAPQAPAPAPKRSLRSRFWAALRGKK